MTKQVEYPIITITRNELTALKSGGYRTLFTKLKQIAANRGLIYNSPKRSSTSEIRFRGWFDKDKNLLLQNYAVDLTPKGTYVDGSGPFVTKGKGSREGK